MFCIRLVTARTDAKAKAYATYDIIDTLSHHLTFFFGIQPNVDSHYCVTSKTELSVDPYAGFCFRFLFTLSSSS